MIDDIDECRKELKTANDEFRTVSFQPWSWMHALDLQDARSAVGFWQRRLKDAIASQARRDAATARDESIDGGVEADEAGNFWSTQ